MKKEQVGCIESDLGLKKTDSLTMINIAQREHLDKRLKINISIMDQDTADMIPWSGKWPRGSVTINE